MLSAYKTGRQRVFTRHHIVSWLYFYIKKLPRIYHMTWNISSKLHILLTWGRCGGGGGGGFNTFKLKLMRHFIWVFTVCQSTRLSVSRMKRWCFFCGIFLLFAFCLCLCHTVLSVSCSLVVTCGKGLTSWLFCM